MTRLFVILIAAAFAAMVSGCNTIEGAGKDVQAGGEKIKDEAKENKPY
jgi:predicted small secreted protein